MKKALLYLIIMIIFSGLSLYSCQKKNKKEEKTIQSEKTSPINKAGEIVTTIIPFQYDTIPVKIKLSISNNTTTAIEFGADYEVEQLVENTWQPIPFPDGIAFIAIMYGIAPGESQTYDIYLYPDMIEYKPGRYRIKKNIFTNEEKVPYFASFEIN